MAMEYHRMETEQSSHQSKHGGSSIGRQHIPRNRVSANEQIMRDYFAEDPLFPPHKFRRRFRMNRDLFLCILNNVQQHDDYFVQKVDAAGYLGLSGHQKMIAAFRMLEYGMPADSIDDYLKIGESTTIESLKRFTRAIVNIYGEEYLQSPNEADVARLLQEGESRGFPGRAPPANYTVNGHQYNMGYYLADGIYPKWATIVQTISKPDNPKKRLFARRQESCRKDVERAFGVLQSRFGIVRGPARFWYREDLTYIMKTCIILHNMIIEDERDNQPAPMSSPFKVSRAPTPVFAEFLARRQTIQSPATHHALRNDLIEHLWDLAGEQE